MFYTDANWNASKFYFKTMGFSFKKAEFDKEKLKVKHFRQT